MYAAFVGIVLSFSIGAHEFYNLSRAIFETATRIDFIYPEDTLVISPKNIWFNTFKIEYLDKDANLAFACFFYFPASQAKPGAIKIVKNMKSADCKNMALEESSISILEIYNLKYNIKNRNFIIYIDKDTITYDLYNLGDYKHKIFEAPIKDTTFKGILFLSEDISYYKKSRLKDGTLCREVEDDCSFKFDNCALCQSNWHEVVGSKCSSHYNRFCGSGDCGLKGNPACIRGAGTVSLDSNLYCINDSPFGFCDKGLRVICINNILKCI